MQLTEDYAIILDTCVEFAPDVSPRPRLPGRQQRTACERSAACSSGLSVPLCLPAPHAALQLSFTAERR